MKMIIKLFLAIFCLSLSMGCSRREEGGKIKILSTTSQVGDLVSFMCLGRAESSVLIRGELDPHSYELVKGDGERLMRANIIFCNGLGLEHGASLASFLKESEKAVALGDAALSGDGEKTLYKDGVIDPHVWMDVSLWAKLPEKIADALIGLDPEGEAIYRERERELTQALLDLDEKIYKEMQAVSKEKRYLVTSHDAFAYFTRRYLADPTDGKRWEDRFAAPEGLAPEGQLNPQEIQKIVDFLYEKQIGVIFPESNVNRDSLKKIISVAKEKGLHVRICPRALYGDAMGSFSYAEMMAHNSDILAEHLR